MKYWKFILPLMLWLFLMRDFLSGAIPLNMDTNTIYGVAKYYFNNILNGVVPLWEPFVTLGRPFYALSICNLFNPITQIIIVLKVLGVNYGMAFIIYMVVYFCVGCFGFYLLAKQILKDRWIAYLAFLCFLFSSLSVAMFTQFTFLEIIIPAIWFFYFLLAFAERQRIGNFIGLSLSVMMVLSSYLPFYFLAVFFVFGCFYVLLFFKETLQFAKNKIRFVVNHPWVAILCVVGIIVSAGPLLSYKVLDASGDSVSPGRHCQYSSAQECYDRTMSQKGGMLYDEIARSGGLGERLDVGYLFAHQDKITYGSDSLLFVPVWVYLLIAMSVFLSLDRLNVFILGMTVVVGMIALGNSGPLHKFLYDHVFFFAYFRNLFFLGAFLVPLVILFGMKQLKSLLGFSATSFSQRKMAIVGVLSAHVAFFFFLRHYDGVMVVSLVSVVLSAALFSIYYSGLVRLDMRVWAGIMGALIILQPVCVMTAYAANATEFKCPLPSIHVQPVFAWVRPDKPAMSDCRIYQFVPYEDFWYAMSMTDAPSKVGYPQASARWTFDLSQRIGDEVLSKYAKYKVYLYDDLSGPGVALTGPIKELDVAHFDVNRVVFSTNFDRPKVLVYNDSFTNAWKASIDGRPQELLRANGAFKGVQVPQGEHRIEFSYHPPGGGWVYVAATIILFVFLIALLLVLHWRL